MIYRCIAAQWLQAEHPNIRRVYEGEFDDAKLLELNKKNYNIYFLPNYPSVYHPGETVDGSKIDLFRYVFVDYDLKRGTLSKLQFVSKLKEVEALRPTLIVDSGNGIHAYWQVSDLDATSYLKLQRRLCRYFDADEAVSQIYQLMRAPGFNNVKEKGNPKPCAELSFEDRVYTCEQLDLLLPPLTPEDAQHCQQHFDKTYKIGDPVKINDDIPPRFGRLLSRCQEVKDIWSGNVEDRSTADYRLGHLMFADGFSRDEALSVLVNCQKALERSPSHRVSYATNIVDKIWTYEIEGDKETKPLARTVREILSKGTEGLKGVRFACHKYIDATEHGFRLGHVIGLVAGSGVGKTAMALNMFMGFVQNNPDYDHLFIPLEQTDNEIADRWARMCGDQTHLHDKVHVLSNYDEDGSFRHLSFSEIKDYILRMQSENKRKIGCVVIDHIGALRKAGAKDGEKQDLMAICHAMKAFAIETKTLLVMQSQAPREKAGSGDLELGKDAAYGTVYFESYCDYLITIWQPLKRCYSDSDCPGVTAYKFCKIRHKRKGADSIQEDVCYRLLFDPETELMRPLTSKEEAAFDFFNSKATNLRKLDRKTDLVPYKSTTWLQDEAVIDGNSSLG